MALNLSQKFPMKTNQAFAIRKASSSTFESVLLVVVIALFYWFVITPKQAQMSEAETTYQQAQHELSVLNQNKENLKKSLLAYSRHKEDVVRLDEVLPLDSRTPKIYLLVESMVERSGMSLGELTVGSVSDKVMAGNTALIVDPFGVERTLNKVSASVSATGNFEQFLAFLNYLETSGRLIDVSSIDISSNQDEELQFSTQLTTYFYE